MERCIVTGEHLRCLFTGGLEAIEEHQQEVDSLNVFPVPDGDTGRNMYLTMAAAVKELETATTSHIGKVGEAIAQGSLMGARGNSGVILSQLLRGLTDGLKGKETITLQEFANAWEAAVASAYRAVIKPVEGTMLTVSKSFARGMKKAAVNSNTLEEALAQAIKEGYDTLMQTPEMLPVLKKAGVVDAGGKGLLVILEGGLQALSNGSYTVQKKETKTQTVIETIEEKPTAEEDFTYLYCTEFLLEADPAVEADIKSFLNGMGGSMVTGCAGSYIKVHIHTNNPGKVLDYCLQYGTLHDIKIDNMYDQWKAEQTGQTTVNKIDTAINKSDVVDIGIVAVGCGEGIKQLFYNLGVQQVIEGGQTMNPPVEEFVRAIKETNGRQVLILPNNKNLILAAQQAKELVDIPVEVIPSKSIPAGISALLLFNDSMTLEENKDRMTRQLQEVKTGEVTYAVRDAMLGEQEIKKGELIGLYQGEIAAAGSSQESVVLALLDKMIDEDDELITIYWGADVEQETVEKIIEQIEEKYPELEVDSHNGGQPLYYYLISVE
ncbi:MAG TPA: DAK2 domain-containing protein [Syntrophomonadaceae bacterium]|nr:DAK2 domain-containing protein [Syntrophomonadaceae bacterium]